MITQGKFSDESKMPRIPVSWEKKNKIRGLLFKIILGIGQKQSPRDDAEACGKKSKV